KNSKPCVWLVRILKWNSTFARRRSRAISVGSTSQIVSDVTCQRREYSSANLRKAGLVTLATLNESEMFAKTRSKSCFVTPPAIRRAEKDEPRRHQSERAGQGRAPHHRVARE